jgi:hypothetical protein
MYDNPPGTVWWTACKTELDARNSEQMTKAVVETSRALDKIHLLTERQDSATDKLLQVTTEISELMKGTRDSGRRMEIASYLIVAVTVVQLFYIAYQMFGKH